MSIREEYYDKGHGTKGIGRLVFRLSLNMLRKLLKKKNRNKRHWNTTNLAFLMDRFQDEVREFMETPTWDEAADVANLAAMCADIANKGEYDV